MTLFVQHRPAFSRDVSGAGLGEYALLAALIAGVSVIAVTSLGIETRGTFSQIADVTQEAGGGAGGGGSGSGGTSGGSAGGGSGDNGSGGSGGSGDGGGASPAPGTPGENFAITLGSQALPPANRLTPWSFDFSSLIAFQDPGTVDLSNLSWSGGSPSLPSWMSLDPNTGVASGTPDVSGQGTFEVVASYLDEEGRQVFTLDVQGALVNVAQIAAGGEHTCVVSTTNQVWCWGANAFGQLGNGTTVSSSVPVLVSGLSDVVAVATGFSHTCALRQSGELMCWGRNWLGQLGDGSLVDKHSPVPVADLPLASSVSAGHWHTCAVTISGGAWCWGQNGNGQLGDNSTTRRTEPVAVWGLQTGVVSIAAGSFHTCAVTNAGAALCWGWGNNGQIGDGQTAQRIVPANVTGLSSGVSAIAAGLNHTCALLTSGAVRCWGNNRAGEIGDGTTSRRLTSVAVTGLSSGVTSIAVRAEQSCAATGDGSVVCWGDNASGQLGDGTISNRSTATPVLGLQTGVTAVTMGWEHACVTQAGGAAFCWGSNDNGRIGDGTLINRTAPVDVRF